MRMKFFIFTITVLMISCADILSEEEPSTAETSDVVGFWFACEFGWLEPDCMILDDDGLQFTEDGKVYYIQEYTQMSKEECNNGPCFDYSLDTVIVERMMLVGNYTYSNSSISLSDSLNNSCVERITWNDDISFFIGNYCLGSEEPYMKKYNGIVVIN
tara:strand:+ start:177 stop:650 length:474 start_codon:yes stop_codon:yes gene_type:complete